MEDEVVAVSWDKFPKFMNKVLHLPLLSSDLTVSFSMLSRVYFKLFIQKFGDFFSV